MIRQVLRDFVIALTTRALVLQSTYTVPQAVAEAERRLRRPLTEWERSQIEALSQDGYTVVGFEQAFTETFVRPTKG